MGNPPFESMYLLLKMVVFHCYASLPEGTLFEGTVPCTYSLALLTAHQAEYLEELYTADRSYLF